MSTKSFSHENKNKYDEEFCHFLTKRILKNGGSVQFQHLTGHLSCLRPEVRNIVGTTMPELKSFLKKHNDIFKVHDDIVSLSKSSVTERKDDSDINSNESKIFLPERIDGIGVIVKLCPEYGFIKTKEPIKTTVFFRALHMGYEKSTNLMECGINIGTMVCFRARKERDEQQFTSKYCAIKVWKNKTIDEESIQKPRKKPETGLYDPLKLEGEGVIQKVFPNLGFIAVDGNENNTVFFHKNRLVNYDNIVDLTKFLSKGDVMEFCAHRSTKPDVKARWEATKVWKKSGKSVSSKRPCHLNASQIQSSSDSGLGENDSQSAVNIKYQNTMNEIIRNQKGKICPRSHGAVIKFGDDLSKLADGDSSSYFISGAEVLDVGWEFDEGDSVMFDAVKIKSAPGWKATLVWVGEKPVIDESTFNEISEPADEEIEIPDENDSSVSGNIYSMSSNSSVKSVSVKSESATSKSNNYDKAKSDCFIDKEVKKSNQNNKPSLYSSSRSSSQNSLSSFVDSKVFQKSRKELREKSSSREHNSKERKKELKRNSMYVADDSSSSSKENISDIVSSEHSQSSVVGSQDDDDDNDLKTALDYLKTKDKDTLHEGDDSNKKSKNAELNSENKHNSTKGKSSIKKNQNVCGKILQVYPTFAEVESSEMLKAVGFFSSVFYYNKKSAEELELSSLKEVLKVGDTVYFNYFEIVDDSSQNWIKVTMAWKGKKPLGVVELTPEDFIKQNDLPFTKNEETTMYKTEEIPSKKFLTSYEDFSPEYEAAECTSLTESCMDNDETLLSVKQADKSETEAPLNDDFEELPNRISEILRNKELFFADSQVDLNLLATDIINLVLEGYASKKSRQDSLKDFLPPEMRSEKLNSDVVCSSCGKNMTETLCNQNSDLMNVEVQTIITGEVMAQNIFTNC